MLPFDVNKSSEYFHNFIAKFNEAKCFRMRAWRTKYNSEVGLPSLYPNIKILAAATMMQNYIIIRLKHAFKIIKYIPFLHTIMKQGLLFLIIYYFGQFLVFLRRNIKWASKPFLENFWFRRIFFTPLSSVEIRLICWE